jgi:superfamily II DNA or RNA helicase
MELIGRYNLVIVNAQKFGGKSGSSLSSVKTIEDRQKVREQLQDFDTIIIDEAHHYPAKTWENIVNVFQGKMVVFLTATPFRGSLGNETSMKLLNSMEMVYEISSSELEGKSVF